MYGSVGVFLKQSWTPLRKAYFLDKFVHAESDDIKKAWAGRASFTTTELVFAIVYRDIYRQIPRNWALLPISFIMFELGKFLRTKFLSFYEKKN